MVALKLVEIYGFSAASAWAGRHVAVPSQLVRYALNDGRLSNTCVQFNIASLATLLYFCASNCSGVYSATCYASPQ